MSSAIMILFDKGEIIKVKEWFKRICPVDRYPDFPIPDIHKEQYNEPLLNYFNVNDRGIYVSFIKNRMELDCAIWDDVSKGFSVILAQELIRKYKTKNVGADSIGYTGIDDFMTWKGCYSGLYKDSGLMNKNNWREKIEKSFREKVKEIVNE